MFLSSNHQVNSQRSHDSNKPLPLLPETFKLSIPLFISTPNEDMFLEINQTADLSDIVKFKPSELLNQRGTSTLPLPSSIPTGPHYLNLVRSKILNQNEINFSFLCKKGIKYSKVFTLASYHLRTNSKNNNALKKKTFSYLKRVKVCPTFMLVEGDLLPFTQKDVMLVRRESLQMVKTIRRGQWSKYLKDFSKYRTLKSLNSCSLSDMKIPLSIEKLNFKQFFASEKMAYQAQNQLKRLNKLVSLNLTNEDLADVLGVQDEVSKALKGKRTIKELSLHCYFKQEFENKQPTPQITLNTVFWSLLTELSIYNFSDDSTIHLVLDNISTFQSLRTLNYSEVRSNYRRFSILQRLKELPSLKKLVLSITLPDSLNEEEVGSKLFRHMTFPSIIESLALTITGTKPWKFLRQVSQSRGFFGSLSQLENLVSFSISIATYTFIDFEKQEEKEIVMSFNFFHKLISSLPKQLAELTLSLFQPVLMSSPPLNDDKMLYIVTRDLKNLKNLTLNFLGINLTPKELDAPVLSRLRVLTLYNLNLPFSSLSHLEATHIEELNCWISGNVEFEDAILFLREINFLTSLKVLQLQFSKLNHAKLTYALLFEIAKVFLNFKALEDFNLGITPIVLERQWGEWFAQLCQYKKGLRFCSLKFRNYQITKEYFNVCLKDP